MRNWFKGALAVAALVGVMLASSSASSNPLSGPWCGISFGHIQTTETVRFPQGSDYQQVNDVSGNTIVPGARCGYSYAQDGGLFIGAEVFGMFPLEPYPTSIFQAFGREYVVSQGLRGGVLGRLGYATERQTAIYAILGTSVGTTTYTLDGDKQTRNPWTIEYGLGMETRVWRENTRLRLDVQYAPYTRDDPWYTKGVNWTFNVTLVWGF